jgi:hypothetical protein
LGVIWRSFFIFREKIENMSKFTDWNLQRLNKRFGLRQNKNSVLLQEWLEGDAEMSDFEQKYLEKLRQNLNFRIDYFNEQELIMKAISPMVTLVNFDTDYFSAFSERRFTGVIDGEEMIGEPDLIIAEGSQEPESMFFCLHEYKKSIDSSGDSVGQCLAAMMVAQELNDNDIPIYGCSVLGDKWRFIILKDKEYAISEVFIETQDEIFEIFRILKILKQKLLIYTEHK